MYLRFPGHHVDIFGSDVNVMELYTAISNTALGVLETVSQKRMAHGCIS